MKSIYAKNTPPQLFASQAGFTLIEVTIALVILVIGILGVFSMQLMTVKGNSNAITISQSVQEASGALDRAESLGYSDAALTAGTGQDVASLYPSDPEFRGTLTYDVKVLDDAGLQNLFDLKHDDFSGSGYECKVIDMSAVQRSSGIDRTIQLQYVKVDF